MDGRGEQAPVESLDRVREISRIKDQARQDVASRAFVTALAVAGGLVAASAWLALTTPVRTLDHLPVLLALTAVYVVAYRIEFVAEGGSMVPTQPVLIALLMLAPLHLVPLAVLGAILAGSLTAQPAGGWYGWAVRALPATHVIGPVLVLLAGAERLGLDQIPTLVMVLLAQFVIDAATAALRLWSIGIGAGSLVGPLSWTFRVDALMAVLGVALVTAAGRERTVAVVLLVSVPVVLVRILSRDRVAQVETAISIEAAYEHVHAEANSDTMTGLANRRRWESAIGWASIQQSIEESRHVGVVMTDLDGLKAANDTRGHDTGDRMIIAFARVLEQACPSGGVVARLGGDEFGLLMVTEAPVDGEALLARIRGLLDAHPRIDGVALSASLGFAGVPPASSVTEAIRRADESAGQDKRQRKAGRR